MGEAACGGLKGNSGNGGGGRPMEGLTGSRGLSLHLSSSLVPPNQQHSSPARGPVDGLVLPWRRGVRVNPQLGTQGKWPGPEQGPPGGQRERDRLSQTPPSPLQLQSQIRQVELVRGP